MRRLALSLGLAVLTFLALALPAAAGGGCVGAAPLVEGTAPSVTIVNCAFNAGVLRVPVGSTVTWTNGDWLPHVVSGVGWGRTQTVMNPGDAFSHEFTAAGIYPYTCTLHPGMSAVVLVGDVGGPAPAAPADPAQPAWPGIALVAALAVGAISFVAGRSLARA
jgi:plastocyanin